MTIQENISLKELTTLKIGGTARYFCAVSSLPELKEALAFANKKQLPFFVLGGGSNLLVSDGEINALVVKNEIKGVEWKDDGESFLVTAGAGESWDALVVAAVERGLWGIENLSGIPGTVGAAPVQNIGAYGAELADVLERVEVFDAKTGAALSLSASDCATGYRESVFKSPASKDLVLTRVMLRLNKTGAPNLEYKDLARHFEITKTAPNLGEIRRAVLAIRARKFPDLTQFGTAGSFFKNPIIPAAQFAELKKRFPKLPGFPLDEKVKVPLAWILDRLCNLKGKRRGAVGLFENQPIVLVNFGGASAEEVSQFAALVASSVSETTGIKIEWEVQHLR